MAKKKEKTQQSRPSNKSIVFWIIGLCAFVSFMLSGILWLLQLIGVTFSALSQLKMASNLILTISAGFAGWVWLCGIRMDRKLKLILKITYVVFLVLAILGTINIGL